MAFTDQVSVDPTSVPPSQIEVAPQGTPLSPEVAADRAYKAAVGSSHLLQGLDQNQIFDGLVQGKEPEYRQAAASQADVQNSKDNEATVINAFKQGTDPVPFLNGPADPETIFEEQFGKHVAGTLDTASQNMPDNPLQNLLDIAPELVQTNRRDIIPVVAKREYAITLKQNLDEVINSRGLFQSALDIAPTLLQPYLEYNLRQVPVEGLKMLGDNLDEQRKNLYRLPLDQYKTVLKGIIDQLTQQNPQLAAAFLEGMIGQTTDEKSINNIFTLLGISDAATAAKFGAKGLKAVYNWNALRLATRDVIAAARGPATEVNMTAATGDVGTAAVKQEAKRFIQAQDGSNKPIQEAMESIPSGLRQDVQDIKANPGRLGQGLANMLADSYERFSGQLLETMTTVSKVMRIPIDQASEQVLKELKDNIRYQYPEISNQIMDISNPQYNPLTNTYYYSLDIGRPGGILFSNIEVARTFAQNQGLKDAEIVRQGLGYYVRITKPLNEESEIAQKLLITPDFSQSAYKGYGLFRKLITPIDWLITPENTLAVNQRMNRKVATYAQANLRKLADEQRRYLTDIKNGAISFDPVTGEKLPWYARKNRNYGSAFGSIQNSRGIKNKERWEALERTLEHNQYMKNPVTEEEGYYFKTPQELEEHYLGAFGRLPELEEINAYFAHKRLTELDRIQRNFSVYRNKSRLGVETHTFSFLDQNGNKVVSPEFDGVRRTLRPKTDDGMLLQDPHDGSFKIVRANELISPSVLNDKQLTKDRVREGLETRIAKGKSKVIEIYDPESRPLEGFNGIKNERIRYVVVNSTETKPIQWDQIPRRGGGHFEYDYEHYIKQAKIRPDNVGNTFYHWYEGDQTVMPVAIRAMGKDVADRWNGARALLNDGKEAEAKAYFEAHPTGVEWDEFRGWFKKGHLNTEEPFYVVPRGRKILDLDDSLVKRYSYQKDGRTVTTFKDGTRQGSLARQFQVEYTGKRDAENLMTVNNVGTKSRPLYTVSQAKKVDPVPMMNRALSRITNSSFMDDYKISAMEHWVREAAPHLDYTPGELAHAPFMIFSDPKFKAGADPAAVSALKANRYKIQKFVGVPSGVDKWLHTVGQKLADSVYDNFGPKTALVPGWLLPRVTNPINFIRSMVYHDKLGLFAIPQLLVQNMTYVTMFSIAPKHTLQALPAVMLHQWSRINSRPEILSALGRKLEKFGWKPGQWEEALKEGQNTGFFHVGGEYVNLDNASKYRVFRTAAGVFLDAGQVFFKEGERNVRFGAWYIAFKEFRDAHPTGRITLAERNQILERADFLYTNMSRASASMMHTGVFGLTTQFLSYQLRLMELFWSKRIGETLGERMATRARMFAVNWAIYGAPVGVGVAGFPFGEALRKYANDNGYIVGEKFWSTLLMEGLPAMAMALITGKGDVQKGNVYNFGERYGTQGLDPIRDVLYGDKPFWSLLFGASGSVLGNTLSAMSPMVDYALAWKDGLPYTLHTQDFVKPLLEVQSVNAAWHAIAAYNTGLWMSKSGRTLEKNVSLANALFMAGTGMQNQDTAETYRTIHSLAQEHEYQKYTINKMADQITQAMRAFADNQNEVGNELMKNADTLGILAFGPDRNADAYAQAFARAQKAGEAVKDQVDYRKAFQSLPVRSFTDKLFGTGKNQFEQRVDEYTRKLQLQQKRGE